MSGRDFSFPAARPAESGFSPSGLERLASVFVSEVERGTIPGAVILLGQKGRIAFDLAVGQSDPAIGAPMRPDSLFRIFSMTKALTCTGALMLMEEGRLLLDDPVSKYIPAFADTRVAEVSDGAIGLKARRTELTLHHLFLHTGGLTHEIVDSPLQDLYASRRLADRWRTNEEHANEIAALPLLCEPGMQWNYSRSIEVLGRVIEVVTGKTLGEVLAECILRPLGMDDTAFSASVDMEAERLAQPFSVDPWSGRAVSLFDMRERPTLEAGGGGLVSTAPDYARFAQMIMNEGVLGGTRILGSRTVRFMLADHLSPSITHRPAPLLPGYGFGLGFAVRTVAGRSPNPGSVGQFFWNGSAGTQFFADPSEGLWAVLMVQAPEQREYLRGLFRNLVYAALEDN